MKTTFAFDSSKVIVAFGNKNFFGENLALIAHSYYLDLLVIYKQILYYDDGDIVTRTILTTELEAEGISLYELDKIAKENTARLLPAVLGDFMGMQIITNVTGSMGASAVLYSDLVKTIADEMESDLFLIPSSIHEFIVLPTTSHFDVSDLSQMIEEANTALVDEKDILSGHPYRYFRETGKIAIA